MPNNNLLKKLKKTYPDIHFKPAQYFKWSAATSTIYYDSSTPNIHAASLLHEVAHAILKHTSYETDIERLQMESSAWHYAQYTLGPQFGVSISDDEKQDALDTYREWLHRRSVCKTCQVPGIQMKTDTYQCLNCKCQWHVSRNNRRNKSSAS